MNHTPQSPTPSAHPGNVPSGLLQGSRYWLFPLAVALLVRVGYALADVPDYWGDGFHSWLMERLTLANGGVYSDYKGREVVWMPLFRYLAVGVMAVTGWRDLLPGHMVSLVMGTLACGVVAVAAFRLTGERVWGLAAGLLMAVSPWHVAYSWMNMPEATGTLFIALALLALVRGGGTHPGPERGTEPVPGLAPDRDREPWWLLLVAVLGVLTRNDVTSVLLLAGAWLAWRRRWRGLALLALGMVAGMAIWSLWTWHQTGNPLWWLARRAAGSTDDAAFWTARGVRPGASPLTVASMVLQAFTPAVVLAWAGWGRFRRSPGVEPLPDGWGLVALTGLGYGAVACAMSLRFFSYPDPRYLMAALPALVLLTVAVVARAGMAQRRRYGVALAVVAAVALVAQLPTFAFRYVPLERYESSGRFLSQATDPGGTLWVDAPVTIYYSDMDPGRFRSSDQLVPASVDPSSAARMARRAVEAEDVRMILYDEVPFSRVHELWPRMQQGEAFIENGLSFRPVFRYESSAAGDGLGRRIRARIEARYGPLMLWSVQVVESP